ncbi:DUF7003 family protein [Nocardioides sp. J54]|uniref:DUF7003 family protein n=1 Tax=Nocardioides sp. J54 TaxID=935866 RepID=UPI0004AFF4AE|nr:hypothetical protein [Nocardioides sp. J54]
MISADEVLAQLDSANADFKFPDLNHGYYYAMDCRLHAFGDGARWALVVEALGYTPRGMNVYDVLHYFGNCLTSGGPGFENEDFLGRIENMDDVEDRDEPEVFAGIPTIRVRDQDLPVDAAPGTDLIDVFRTLVPEHRDVLLATETEVRRRIPADLPKLLQLDEWHQPELFETPPSASEVYRQLAQVLVTADSGRYQPTEPPNTHWSKWPESGSL